MVLGIVVEIMYLGNRNPRHKQRQDQADCPDDPICFVILRPVISEEDIENNATKVPGCAGETRYNTVVGGMNVRDDSEIGAVSCFRENSGNRNGSYQSMDAHIRNCANTDHDNALHSRTYQVSKVFLSKGFTKYHPELFPFNANDWIQIVGNVAT